MTKEEAEKQLNLKSKHETPGFCPLINRECIKTCVCYRPPKINQEYPAENNYEITDGYCNNAMFYYD